MHRDPRPATDLAREELTPLLAELRNGHDVLPFMDDLIASSSAEFVPMPEAMMDVFCGNGDFEAPRRGSGITWLEMIDPAGQMFQLVVARPKADGELWMVAPAREAKKS